MSIPKLEIPATIDLTVRITNGKTYGEIVVGICCGKYPSDKDISDAIAKAKKEAKKHGFRLVNPDEMWRIILGTDKVAVPNQKEWAEPHSESGGGQKY